MRSAINNTWRSQTLDSPRPGPYGQPPQTSWYQVTHAYGYTVYRSTALLYFFSVHSSHLSTATTFVHRYAGRTDDAGSNAGRYEVHDAHYSRPRPTLTYEVHDAHDSQPWPSNS